MASVHMLRKFYQDILNEFLESLSNELASIGPSTRHSRITIFFTTDTLWKSVSQCITIQYMVRVIHAGYSNFFLHQYSEMIDLIVS